MSNHSWLSAALLLQAILQACLHYGRLRKARRDNQLHLVAPLRWQILGHILLGIGWSVGLISDLFPIQQEVVQISGFIFFFAIGLAAIVYGQRRERTKLAA
jgi:hypothetical protein